MMRRFKKRISTKILFWFILVNALTIASITFLVYENMSRKLIADELQELASIRDLAAGNLLGGISELIDLAATVARTPLLAEVLAGWVSPERGSTYLREVHSAHQKDGRSGPTFINLVDVSGTIIASSGLEPIGRDISQRRYVQAALSGSSGFAGPYQSKVLKETRGITNYAPLKKDGQVIGAVLIPLDLERLSEFLTSQEVRIDQSGETYLVGIEQPPRLDNMEIDTYKKMITKSRFAEGTVQDVEVDTEAVRECIEGRGGAKIIKGYRGVPVFSAYAPLEGQGWAIISEIDQAEALAGLLRLRNIIILFGIGCLGVVSFVSVLVARSISRPIHQLHVGSERIGAGDLGFQIEIKTGDEIEQLADEFNRMSARLRESYSDLEGRVEERTRALGESERRLRSILAAAKNVSFITTDLEGAEAHILGFSPGAENIFGYSREEVIGKPVAMLHLPEDADRFPEAHESIRQKKEGFSGEATLIRKNGDKFAAFFITYPLLDAKGDVNSVLSVSIDITERKQAEEARQLLVSIVESASDSINSTTLDGLILSWNKGAETVYGYTEKEALGAPISILVPSDRRHETS
ncbi:MAG: PAS domain S-box protein, partial [Deltaproteobacteria bacterium]|nr:PAS domain S-box protein [Deltaproteobacteria bacterium]